MKRFLVIGNPIEHSLSPKLHNYWFKINNINAIYEKKLVEENDIGKIISDIRENKIQGINVTVPFKKKIIPYLDRLSFEAGQTQSVNTIILNNNTLEGHNTDVVGFTNSINSLKFNIKGG